MAEVVCSWSYPFKEKGALPKYLITQSTQYLITSSEPWELTVSYYTQFVDWFAVREYS